jgi:hypothetical protein
MRSERVKNFMDAKLIEIVGKTAGIGGIALGVSFLLFRNFIRKNIFPTLSDKSAYRLIRQFLYLTFGLAILGITAWVFVSVAGANDRKNQSGNGAVLEVTNTEFTHDAEFDVMVRNLGDTDLIVSKIAIKKLEAPGIQVLPILRPTARYHLPVDDIQVGKSKSIAISHVVRAHSADRILIALETTTVYKLEVSFHYNTDQIASFTKWTWDWSDGRTLQH